MTRDQAQLVVWTVSETAGFESAWIEFRGRQLLATGRATGQLPEPYWHSYTLETDEDAATTRLEVRLATSVGERRVDLRRDAEGWTVDGEPREDLDGALDCDLTSSPVTNTMPIVRHALQRGPGDEELLMAFVQIPSLAVIAVRQRYTHLELVGDGARIRYSSGEFSSDLLVDSAGLVVHYPTMATRVPARLGITQPEASG